MIRLPITSQTSSPTAVHHGFQYPSQCWPPFCSSNMAGTLLCIYCSLCLEWHPYHPPNPANRATWLISSLPLGFPPKGTISVSLSLITLSKISTLPQKTCFSFSLSLLYFFLSPRFITLLCIYILLIYLLAFSTINLIKPRRQEVLSVPFTTVSPKFSIKPKINVE